MIRRRNSYTYELYKKQILREIPFKRAFEPLREDVMFLAETAAKMGDTDDARRIYTEAITGQYSGDTVNFIGQFYFDECEEKIETARACAYFELAYALGARNIRCGDYLMMGSYRQFDVEEGRQMGLTRDMNLALKWYLEMLKIDKRAYGSLSYAYMEKEIRDYYKAYECALKAEEDDVRGLYCAGLINEFGLVPQTDRSLAEKYYERVLDQVDDGDLFYDRAVDRLAELRGITAVPFNTRYFENEMDNCRL